MVHTYQDVIVTLTKNYAENVVKNGIKATIAEHVVNLLSAIQQTFEQENAKPAKRC